MAWPRPSEGALFKMLAGRPGRLRQLRPRPTKGRKVCPVQGLPGCPEASFQIALDGGPFPVQATVTIDPQARTTVLTCSQEGGNGHVTRTCWGNDYEGIQIVTLGRFEEILDLCCETRG